MVETRRRRRIQPFLLRELLFKYCMDRSHNYPITSQLYKRWYKVDLRSKLPISWCWRRHQPRDSGRLLLWPFCWQHRRSFCSFFTGLLEGDRRFGIWPWPNQLGWREKLQLHLRKLSMRPFLKVLGFFHRWLFFVPTSVYWKDPSWSKSKEFILQYRIQYQYITYRSLHSWSRL